MYEKGPELAFAFHSTKFGPAPMALESRSGRMFVIEVLHT